MKNIAIITGASSGLGLLFNRAFDQGMGGPLDEIWIIARRDDRLTQIAQQNKTKTRTFSLDLCDDTSFDIIEKTLADDPEIMNVQWLVNNAGFGKFGSFSQISEQDNTDMVRLNALAVVQMCYHSIMYMHAGSRIINIGSAAAFLPQPNLAVYGATKRFVVDFSRTLNFELKDVGIHVTAVCPKFMETEFLNNPGDQEAAGKITKIGFEDPSNVVACAIRDSLHGKDLSIPSLDMKVAYGLCKVLPVKLSMDIQQYLMDTDLQL